MEMKFPTTDTRYPIQGALFVLEMGTFVQKESSGNASNVCAGSGFKRKIEAHRERERKRER